MREREEIELPKRQTKRADHDFLTLAPGSVITIAGVDCRLGYVHRGKRRLTFSPVNAAQAMPVEQMKDPIQKVSKAT